MFINLNLIERADPDAYGEDPTLDVEPTRPVTVRIASIRCYYARRNEKPGTRITFSDGGGFAVSETPDEITAMLAT